MGVHFAKSTFRKIEKKKTAAKKCVVADARQRVNIVRAKRGQTVNDSSPSSTRNKVNWRQRRRRRQCVPPWQRDE